MWYTSIKRIKKEVFLRGWCDSDPDSEQARGILSRGPCQGQNHLIKLYKKIIFGVSYKNNFFPPVGAPDLRQLHREADPQDGEGSAGGPQF